MTFTPTFTATATETITMTATVSPTAGGSDIVNIDVFDSRGEKVIWLGQAMSREIVHDPQLSVNPLRANGTNKVVITDSLGGVIGTWDGKDGTGKIVFSGTYTLQIKTKDSSGNEYIVNRIIDVIAENTYSIDVKIYYGDGFISIFGGAVNTSWIKIRIYNINAELIAQADAQVLGGAYNYAWDLRTTSGSKAAYGLYIVVVEFKDSNTGVVSRKIEKLAVK
jgi:flagellar hook assembly protein FlgD